MYDTFEKDESNLKTLGYYLAYCPAAGGRVEVSYTRTFIVPSVARGEVASSDCKADVLTDHIQMLVLIRLFAATLLWVPSCTSTILLLTPLHACISVCCTHLCQYLSVLRRYRN